MDVEMRDVLNAIIARIGNRPVPRRTCARLHAKHVTNPAKSSVEIKDFCV
jgi:hypothetical protein